MRSKALILVVLFTSFGLLNLSELSAQDPTRFEAEIQSFDSLDQIQMPVKGDILFTGSSSIRLWENLPSYFPTHQIIQRGFGGSHFSDLIYYIDKLVIKYRPSKVFIYEGDNDLYDDKSVSRVIKDAKRTIQLIHIEIPELPIYFISPKPSIARVSHQDKYLKFNKKLKSYCDKNDLLFFIDVWTPMFDESGNLIEGIFIEDGLHMNKKGYQIWQKIIAPYL